MNEVQQLHDRLEAEGIPIYGVSLDESGYSIAYREEATNTHIQEAETILENFEPEPDPMWVEFLAAFQYPGNPLYSSLASKVAESGFVAQDHWANLKMLISTPALQNVGALAAGLSHLTTILEHAEHPVDENDIAEWNALMDEYDFPDECKL